MRPLRHLEPLQDGIRRFRKRRATTGLVLMYHRILPAGVDTWRLNVTPEHFAEHLQVLRATMRPTSLNALERGVRSGHVDERSVVVTFDDGYVNNLERGLPVLEAFDVPATVFVATGYTGSSREFWWDELEQLLVHEQALPSHLELRTSSFHRRWETGPGGAPGHDVSDRADKARPGSRVALFYDIWSALRPLPDPERREALAQISRSCGVAASLRPSYRAMTADEVVRLAGHPLMEIGAHTVTHPFLPELSQSAQLTELADSRTTLEQIVSRPVTSFSYPFGGWVPAMRPLVHEAGFTCATTGVEQTVWHRDHPLSVPRFMVEDWDGAEFERRLSEWCASH